MDTLKLKERQEACDLATYEFKRVKRAKLTSRGAGGNIRERTNRASAAASRAKIMCYSRELEKRTDKLEAERNQLRATTGRTERELGQLEAKNRKLKAVVRELWELKDPKTCAYLVDSNVLFLLSKEKKQLKRSRREFERPAGLDSQHLQNLQDHQPEANANETTHQQHYQHQQHVTAAAVRPSYYHAQTYGNRNTSAPVAVSAPTTGQPGVIRRSSCTENSRSHSQASLPPASYQQPVSIPISIPAHAPIVSPLRKGGEETAVALSLSTPLHPVYRNHLSKSALPSPRYPYQAYQYTHQPYEYQYHYQYSHSHSPATSQISAAAGRALSNNTTTPVLAPLLRLNNSS